MSYRSAGLLYGPEAHHLDHLAVICHLMRIPLIVTDEEIAQQALKYYPSVKTLLVDTIEIGHYLVDQHEVIFYAMPRLLFEEIFFFAQQLQRKRIHTIWCPHGNSDKGHASFFMEALEQEEVALVYGPKMIDFFIKKGVFHQLKAHVVTGNLRYSYYRKNKAFYDEMIEREVTRRLPEALKTLFYAPTWQDSENSSSFFDAAPHLIEQLPENCNLIVKLHPNLLHQRSGDVERLLLKYEGESRVLFLTDFAPIYPLLDLVDVYIGDMSSIGYDFLIFNKPMFFLNQNGRDSESDPGLYLYRCGVEVAHEKYSKFYSIMEKHLTSDTRQFTPIRKEVYDNTFAKERAPEELRQEILNTFPLFSEL
jgi:hypothetical protein